MNIEQIYIDNGYKNRLDYLEYLSNEYSEDKVRELSFILGPSEDFDGLISLLEDDI